MPVKKDASGRRSVEVEPGSFVEPIALDDQRVLAAIEVDRAAESGGEGHCIRARAALWRAMAWNCGTSLSCPASMEFSIALPDWFAPSERPNADIGILLVAMSCPYIW